ncbi:NAD(P)/FAD-dependent oxidoreductase [Alterisphingorhabdus coralli]|uniref:D-amino-acid oxidase n=1 Tax=Alterisphingorhabdus coralli TaxID=3071408 RepID=A0AA97I1J9_9SPHN|nr:FAD-dependent oxidoreductase [Parasphingorhabdus sp. SCSIO 66989]WOE74825.1 FAD-dependent oxidoreductase [Parasphingorhabdus sp. SCSIO 66989]
MIAYSHPVLDQVTPTRREFLATGAILGGATMLSACAPGTEPLANVSASGPCLPKVRASADRAIRQLVGLRPYRPSGFVVRREAIDDKRLVHNYGHGGGGITLGWGSSKLAVDLGLPGHQGPVAVIGAGIMGLTTARLLQEAGQQVTIYTSQLPPETTSNIAGGQWYPSSVFSGSQLTPEFEQQFVAASAYSYYRYQLLVGEHYGVRWMPTYELSNRPINMGQVDRLIANMLPEMQTFEEADNPFGTLHLRRSYNMYIEPARFLRAIQRDILLAGGKITVRHFHDRGEVQALPEKLIFNCTGLGAAELFGDEELIPVRGQLEILLPQPEINYAYTNRRGLYMFPRSDGIVLGGTFERGQFDRTPQPEVSSRIVDGHAAIADAMRCA